MLCSALLCQRIYEALWVFLAGGTGEERGSLSCNCSFYIIVTLQGLRTFDVIAEVRSLQIGALRQGYVRFHSAYERFGGVPQI